MQDDLAAASASLCITSSQYSQTIMLMTHSCHQFMAGPIMAVHQYDCVLNIAQCHQFLIYKQVMYQGCDSLEECLDRYVKESKFGSLNIGVYYSFQPL